MKIGIALGMMVRHEKYVTVEVPDDFKSWSESRQEELMAAVYKEDDGGGFIEDNSWCDEATHYVVDTSDEPCEYRVTLDGDNMKVESVQVEDTIVPEPKILSNEKIASEIREYLAHNPLDRDEYQQWAVETMDFYRDLLEEMGLGNLSIIGGCPNDHWVDMICMRDVFGHEVIVPDPNDNAEEDDPAYVKPVIEFFLSLVTLPRQPVQAASIEALVKAAEAEETEGST